ncbi:hypothetical protein M5689_008199 [Euphorbia peplus]|nr:hypothetical protein M5689_008199 [Euphorbia peplus]
MPEDIQNEPLASSKINPRSDDVELAGMKRKPPPHRRKSNKCLVYILSSFTIACFILLIFAQFVLRPATPDAEINFIRAENLTYTNNNSSSPSFSVTLWPEFKIKNLSFGRFTYENSTVAVFYGEFGVGEATLVGGRVGGKGTNFVNVKVGVKSRSGDGGSADRKLRSDLDLGVLNLSFQGKINGEVDTLEVFKKSRSAVVDCNMNLDLDTKSIMDLFCNS